MRRMSTREMDRCALTASRALIYIYIYVYGGIFRSRTAASLARDDVPATRENTPRGLCAADSRSGIAVRGKSMASTCIRDTAPCRTDEPLGRLTFFHAAACPFDYEHRPVRVLFFSRSHRARLARAFSFSPTAVVHPVRARPVRVSLLSLALFLSPLGRQSPLPHWRGATVPSSSLASGVPLLSSAMSSTCRTDRRHSTGVPYLSA